MYEQKPSPTKANDLGDGKTSVTTDISKPKEGSTAIVESDDQRNNVIADVNTG